MVIFCHVTESLDPDDLKSLHDFVQSLQEAAPALESVAKLHRLCSLLYDVARLYVESKQGRSKQTKEAAPASNEFDMYLSQLGFAPWGAGAPTTGGLVGDGANSTMQPDASDEAAGWSSGSGGLFDPGAGVFAQRSQLEDWFNGNQHIMDLMEDDMPF